jgi:hypothetical protein
VVIAKLCNRIMNGFGATVQQMPENRDSSRRRLVSAKHVAERPGLSRSAVSRALTPGASIAPVTLANFLEAAGALGYAVNDLARGLLVKGPGSRFIALRPTAQVGHGIGLREIVIHYSASATGSIRRITSSRSKRDSNLRSPGFGRQVYCHSRRC